MDDLLSRILYAVSTESKIDVYVDDANNEPFEIYRGKPDGLTQRHLNNALRSSGTFYIFTVYAIKNNHSINDHHNLMHRKEFVWLTPLNKPKVSNTTIHSINITWDKVRFCGYKDDDIGIRLPTTSIKYTVEIAEGHEKSTHGIANYFVTDSTYIPDYITIYESMNVFETTVIDLTPSTWYHIRIKVTYGNSIIYSPAISCFTMQGIPERPEKPHVFVIPMRSTFDPKLLESSYRIKFIWSAPPACGIPITKYHIQIKEVTKGQFSESLIKKTKNGIVMQRNLNFIPEQSCKYIAGIKESPWITVYCNLFSEFLLPGPSKNALEWRVRIRCQNGKGWSLFSRELVLSSQQYPSLFTAAWSQKSK